MRSYWTNFAKYGDPNCEELPLWKPYNIEDDSWLNISHEIKFEKVSNNTELDILQEGLLNR